MLCCRSSCQARIVTEATYPYRVVYVNRAWEDLCGWTADEAIGQFGLAFMQVTSADPISGQGSIRTHFRTQSTSCCHYSFLIYCWFSLDAVPAIMQAGTQHPAHFLDKYS